MWRHLPLNSKIQDEDETRTRFFNTKGVRAREPASFRRENVIAVVILLRVLARIANFRLDYEYEIQYEYDFLNLLRML